MARVYTQLDCGCYVSCDAGGGLIPCNFLHESTDCQLKAWKAGHPLCDWCGECLNCYPLSHEECLRKLCIYDAVPTLRQYMELDE